MALINNQACHCARVEEGSSDVLSFAAALLTTDNVVLPLKTGMALRFIAFRTPNEFHRVSSTFLNNSSE